MADRRYPGRVLTSSAAALLWVALALAGCGVSESGPPARLGNGLQAGTQGGLAEYVAPSGPDSFREPKKLVEAYFDAAAGGDKGAADRVREFLAPKALEIAPDMQELTVVRIKLGNPVPLDDGRVRVPVRIHWIGLLDDTLGKIELFPDRADTSADFVVGPTAGGRLRLEKVPAAMMLRDTALQNPSWYQATPIYFWDSGDNVLVPDLRYLSLATTPAGQRPTKIVDFMIAGPSDWLKPTAEALLAVRRDAVTSSESGLVVNLTAAVGNDPARLARIVSQLRWSLGTAVTLKVEDKVKAVKAPGDGDNASSLPALPADPLQFGVSDKGATRGKVVVLTVRQDATAPLVLSSRRNGNVITAGLSRDMTRLALVRRDRGKLSLWVARAENRDVPAQQASLNFTTASRPSWIYGTDLFLIVADGNLFAVNLRGQVREVTPVGLTGITDAALSADGRRVALLARGRAYVAPVSVDGQVVNLGGKQPQQIGGDLLTVTGLGWATENSVQLIGQSGSTVVAWVLTSDGAVASVGRLDDTLRTDLAGLTDLATYPGGPGSTDARKISAQVGKVAYNIFPGSGSIQQVGDVTLAFYPS